MIDQKDGFLFVFIVHILLKMLFENLKNCIFSEFCSVDEEQLVSLWNANNSGVYGI